MKSILLIVGVVAHFCSLYGQNLTFEFGAMFIHHKSKSELHNDIRGQNKYNSNENFFKINYEQRFFKKWFMVSSYSKYEISTDFNFYGGRDTQHSFGFGGTDMTRIDLSLMYNVFSKRNFIVQPYGGLGLLKSDKARIRFDGEVLPRWIEARQPNVKVLNDIEKVVFSNSQLVPVVGLKFGYAFWGRLELFIDIHRVFGHKTIQEVRMSYSYKGVEQPQVINYTDGSSTFLGYGIGYRFVKSKTKQK